jgi:hypothetical protein
VTAAERRDNAEIRTGRLLVAKNAWCFEGADAQHTSGVLLVPKAPPQHPSARCATTVAATAAFGMELPISVGATPANAQDEHALN